MSKSLKEDTLHALVWSFIERFSHQILQFLFSIFLARLLLPEQFGIIAMTNVFVVIGNSFINSGFGHALVQKNSSNKTDESSIFFFNIIVAFFVSAIIYYFSDSISNFYNEPVLKNILKVLPLTLIFNSLGLVQRTLLSKTLDFKTLTKSSIITSIFSGSLSIYLALKGFGVWSLVVLIISTDFFNTLFLWIFCSWRPIFVFSFTSLKSMFGFGSKLFVISVTNAIFTNIYSLIIGKFFSSSILGFYNRADTLSKYPVVLINSVVSQVTFPVFSKIQDNKLALASYIKASIKYVSLISFPIMFGLMVVANSLIEVVLTEKWLPIVLYLQLFCIIGILYPIQAINLNALNSIGRSDLYLKIDIINKVIIICTLVISFRFGIITVILGQIFNSFLALYLYSFYTGKHFNYTFKSQLIDIIHPLVLSIIMCFIIYLLEFFQIESSLILLLLQILIGVIIYILLCYYTKLDSFLNLFNLVKNYRSY